MKTFVARALQMSYLTRDQIENVQARERMRGYLIPNWNIQEVLGIPSIKEKYGLPEDNELLARHNVRIEAEMKIKGFVKTGEYHEEKMDWIHALDWNVFNRSGEIMWEFSGAKKKGGILARLSKARESYADVAE